MADRRTLLHDLHLALGGRMIAFAGWALPVQYPSGILAEHAACRGEAALFDVSHMGRVALRAPGGPAAATEALERLCPGGLATLRPGQARYTQFTNAAGGVLDDLIVTHAEDRLLLVVNAARAAEDLALMRDGLPGVDVEPQEGALLALQGPGAEAALAGLVPGAARLNFMTAAALTWDGAPLTVSRLGYTGEDGFEIAAPADRAADFAAALLARPGVAPAGLGARDSLRLEAGLPLWGQDIGPDVTPVEAGLGWSIPPRRRAAGDFPGAATILAQLREGPPRRLVGVRPDGPAPARAGTDVLRDGRAVGRITSGGFGPTVGGPVAMALVEAEASEPGTALGLVVRGAARPARVVNLPFVSHRYRRS